MRRYIQCASRALSAAERNYSATALEMQALCWALLKFHHYLYGRKFVVLTDHKSLITMINQANPSTHVQRNFETLLTYDFSTTFQGRNFFYRTASHGCSLKEKAISMINIASC